MLQPERVVFPQVSELSYLVLTYSPPHSLALIFLFSFLLSTITFHPIYPTIFNEGVSIRFQSFEGAAENVWHVLVRHILPFSLSLPLSLSCLSLSFLSFLSLFLLSLFSLLSPSLPSSLLSLISLSSIFSPSLLSLFISLLYVATCFSVIFLCFHSQVSKTNN